MGAVLASILFALVGATTALAQDSVEVSYPVDDAVFTMSRPSGTHGTFNCQIYTNRVCVQDTGRALPFRNCHDMDLIRVSANLLQVLASAYVPAGGYVATVAERLSQHATYEVNILARINREEVSTLHYYLQRYLASAGTVRTNPSANTYALMDFVDISCRRAHEAERE